MTGMKDSNVLISEGGAAINSNCRRRWICSCVAWAASTKSLLTGSGRERVGGPGRDGGSDLRLPLPVRDGGSDLRLSSTMRVVSWRSSPEDVESTSD